MALQNLKTYFESTNRNDFMQLLENTCVVSEKIQASSFHVRKTNSGFEYYKSGSKDAMNKVDRTIVKYYENAIKYFKSISGDIAEQMPTDWKFGFDYMVDKKTVDIEYDKLPKNHLILTHIQVMSPSNPTEIKKVIRDPNILYKWADILNVQRPQVIFQGKLSDYQKEELVKLLEMSETQFKKEFTDASFTRKIYNIFNKGLNSTGLNLDLEKDIDSLILNFFDGKSVKNFKLERFDKAERESRNPSDMYQISILDLVEYISQYDIPSIELKEDDTDIRYIELISILFNSYVEKHATKYIGASFDSADFAQGEEFALNTTFIKNEKTLSLVQKDVLAELYKIALGSFRKKRTKETDIINAALMEQINEIVAKIEALVMGETNEGDVMNFNTYLKTQNLQTQVSPITEALTVKYAEQGKKPVNMFVGRFQPFTLGHAKVIETISKQNGFPVVIFLVKAKAKKKEDAFKRPYDEDLQIEMLNKLKSKYPIKDVYVIEGSAGIDKMFNAMRGDGYEPVLWGTGTDRMKNYGFQVNNQQYREDLGVRADFGLFEIPRTGKNISATQVREAMLADDETLFKKLTPKEIHSMYGDLKDKLEASMATNESTIMTFDQFTKNI